MKNIRILLNAAAVAASALAGPGAFAQMPMDHGQMGASAASGMAEGEVRRIDAGAGKITIRHGEITHLDMPAMTMVFTVADPGLLRHVEVGDRIRFTVERRDGKMVVTHIVPGS